MGPAVVPIPPSLTSVKIIQPWNEYMYFIYVLHLRNAIETHSYYFQWVNIFLKISFFTGAKCEINTNYSEIKKKLQL
jgi:hypothetical protein